MEKLKVLDRMIYSPDKDKVEKIERALERTSGYCPCMIERNQDTICPCKPCREGRYCCCGLFVREEGR